MDAEPKLSEREITILQLATDCYRQFTLLLTDRDQPGPQDNELEDFQHHITGIQRIIAARYMRRRYPHLLH